MKLNKNQLTMTQNTLVFNLFELMYNIIQWIGKLQKKRSYYKKATKHVMHLKQTKVSNDYGCVPLAILQPQEKYSKFCEHF